MAEEPAASFVAIGMLRAPLRLSDATILQRNMMPWASLSSTVCVVKA